MERSNLRPAGPAYLFSALVLAAVTGACGDAPSEPAPSSESAGTAEPGVVRAPASTVTAAATVTYRGVNLNGPDFGSALPGTHGVDYVFPDASDVDYFVGKRMNTFRVAFRWERLQRNARRTFDAAYSKELATLVKTVTARNGYVVLNPQNFARYYGNVIGSSAVPNAVFADLWKRLAQQYKSNPRVLFGLMNEPNTMPTEQWVSAAKAAVSAIRSTGARNVILVPGNGWSGAHSWNDDWYGTPNAVALLGISDPANNLLFEAHQYLDSDSSGQSDTCVSSTIGRERLAPFVAWLRANRRRGFIGELAGGRNATCYEAIADMVGYITSQSDVLVGWTWWAAGPWWPASYPFTLEPLDGIDRPQMNVLSPFLP
ncbi:MAG: glycoside hydrolase family 5 protein [Deltaproteobacteria bacterium]|nr:glycoside hydrolase family 5 protein [Deltaproteobacteria bacterium]